MEKDKTDADAVESLQRALHIAQINDASREEMSASILTLKDAQAQIKQSTLDSARQKMSAELRAIKQLSDVKVTEENVMALLLHVYEKHEPPGSSLSLGELQELEQQMTKSPQTVDEKNNVSVIIRKNLRKALRDYHPDRSGASGDEWNVLGLAISQALGVMNDKLKKGRRGLEP